MKRLVLIFIFIQSSMMVTKIGCNENSEIKYIKEQIKEYAFCKCISEGLINENIKNFDGSAGKIRFTLDVESYIFWKIDSVINNLYLNSNVATYIDGRVIRNYNYRCLKFYESNYLDSLVNTFENDTFLLETDGNTWKKKFKRDSVYFENMIIESQKETKDE